MTKYIYEIGTKKIVMLHGDMKWK